MDDTNVVFPRRVVTRPSSASEDQDAPQNILEQRLVGRERPSDGNFTDRIKRSADIGSNVDPEIIIRNIGQPDVGSGDW
jgi:ribose 1,5-bisphosphokinase PhnN